MTRLTWAQSPRHSLRPPVFRFSSETLHPQACDPFRNLALLMPLFSLVRKFPQSPRLDMILAGACALACERGQSI